MWLVSKFFRVRNLATNCFSFKSSKKHFFEAAKMQKNRGVCQILHYKYIKIYKIRTELQQFFGSSLYNCLKAVNTFFNAFENNWIVNCLICKVRISKQTKYSYHSILFYSILFYSILFYSILFYSILFYSILFYSILFLIYKMLAELHTVHSNTYRQILNHRFTIRGWTVSRPGSNLLNPVLIKF